MTRPDPVDRALLIAHRHAAGQVLQAAGNVDRYGRGLSDALQAAVDARADEAALRAELDTRGLQPLEPHPWEV